MAFVVHFSPLDGRRVSSPNPKKTPVNGKVNMRNMRLLTLPHVEGTNNLSINHNNIKNTGLSILWKTTNKKQ